MKYMDKFFCGLISLLLFISCQPDDLGNKAPASSQETNKWIESVMRDNYLWNDEIPSSEELNYSLDAKRFFESMLSLQDGKPRGTKIAHYYYSYIEESTATKASMGDEEDTYGFEFEGYTLVDENNQSTGTMYARILYVLPDSPASEAGLKRDDWIIKINEQEITTTSSLLNGSALTLTIGKRNKEGMKTDRTVKLPASRKVDQNPLFYHSVLTKGSKKIGYLMYNHFEAGPDNNKDESYNDEMKQIFADFKAKQVNEFILDLRYNPGGLVTCAQLLTTMLAPANALGDVFCIMQKKDNQKTKTTLYLDSKNIKTGANLNLPRIYVLVTRSTASASEAVINCLIPYMGRENITLIGQQTEGKNVGSNTFGENDNYGWVLHPITLYIYNKDGNADYDNGFVPDIHFNELDGMDNFVELKEIGDENDPLLAIALQQITGVTHAQSYQPDVKASSPRLKQVYSSIENRGKGGLLLP